MKDLPNWENKPWGTNEIGFRKGNTGIRAGIFTKCAWRIHGVHGARYTKDYYSFMQTYKSPKNSSNGTITTEINGKVEIKRSSPAIINIHADEIKIT